MKKETRDTVWEFIQLAALCFACFALGRSCQ